MNSQSKAVESSADASQYAERVVRGSELATLRVDLMDLAEQQIAVAYDAGQESREKLRQLMAYVEARLASVAVPSGCHDVSRAFADIRQTIAHINAQVSSQ